MTFNVMINERNDFLKAKKKLQCGFNTQINKHRAVIHIILSDRARYPKLHMKAHKNTGTTQLQTSLSLLQCVFPSLTDSPLFFRPAQFDFKGCAMQPALPAPSSLRVTGPALQDVCLRSTQAPPNPVSQTSCISVASHRARIKTVASAVKQRLAFPRIRQPC